MCIVLYFYLFVESCLLTGLRILRIKVKLVFFFFFKLQVDCPLIFHRALDNTSYTHATLPNLPIIFPFGLSNLIPIALQIDTLFSQSMRLETIQQTQLAHPWGKKNV